MQKRRILLTTAYDALLDAGASKPAAVAAAEELAGYEHRFTRIEADLNLLKWMVGTNVAATLAVLVKSFVP